MYCSSCASPITAGLKFCNRCGANLRSHHADAPGTNVAHGLTTAVVLVAMLGLGSLFGGALVLKQGAGLNNDIIALFMFFTFVIVGIIEIFLLRQLARTLSADHRTQRSEPVPPLFQPAPTPVRELNAVRDTAEPIGSVTENTTRTLEHSLRNVSR